MMSFLCKFNCWISGLCSYLQSPLLLAIRLVWGIQFMMAGFGKFLNLEKTATFFSSIEIPFPFFNACLVAGVEFFGGLLLVIGLASRIAAIPLAITMVTAYITAHSESVKNILTNPQGFINESPFLFLYASLVIIAFGAGFFSLDRIWKNRAHE